MFSANPFAILTEFISHRILQACVVLMILAVVLGTLFDLVHDRKALFFLRERRRARQAATRRLGAGDMAAIVTRALLADIATFGEFCNLKRRISHALMFYGFVLYLITTLVLVFCYAEAAPAVLPALWHLGAEDLHQLQRAWDITASSPPKPCCATASTARKPAGRATTTGGTTPAWRTRPGTLSPRQDTTRRAASGRWTGCRCITLLSEGGWGKREAQS